MAFSFFHIISTLILFLLFSLSVDCTQGSEINCTATIKVPRNTLFKAPVMTLLIINCTVTMHECQNSRIYWCKIYGNDCKALNHSDYIKAEWKSITEHDGIAFLTFLNISMEDEGLYRCRFGETTVSHSINVTVTDQRDLTSQQVDHLPGFWYDINICRWTAGLVVILTGVFLIIRRAKSKNETDENQGMTTTASDPSYLASSADDHPLSNIPAQLSSSSHSLYANMKHL